MMPEQTPPVQSGPYSQAAIEYRKLGWFDVLPLPSGKKSHPPTGYTGKRFAHVTPTDEQIATWIVTKPTGNVALRMPADVLGIDVDAYEGKQGSDSLAAAEARMGPLPKTWRVTSRDDGTSGIRFYRVPEGLAWPNQVGPAIETIHRGHRYAVVWPSIHPEGRPYRWIDPEGIANIGPGPSPDDLAELPSAWVLGLTRGEMEKPATDRLDATPEEVAVALADWCTPGAPCGLVNKRVYEVDQAIYGQRGSRHDAIRDQSLAILRLGQVGHLGVGWALTHTADAFIQAVGEDRGQSEAQHEWKRMLIGGVQIVLASMRPAEPCRGANCDGKIQGLEFDLDQFLAAPDSAPDSALPESDDTPSIYADLSWLLTGERPVIDPPAWVQRSDGTSLFYDARINGVFGDPETAKSWLAMCAVAEALNAGHRAVYLDVDHNGASEIASRLIQLGAPVDRVADPEHFRIAEPEDILGLKQFIQDMRTWMPRMAVVDSLGEIVPMLGLKSTDNDDITKAIRAVCKPLAHDIGACVITIDHLPKGAESRGTGYAIGGTAKKRAVDGSYLSAEVLLAPAPGKLGKISLTIEKDRNGALRETSPGKHAGTFILDSSEPGKTVWKIELPSVTSDGRMRPTILMERVSRFVEDWSGPGLPTRNEITKGVKGKDGAVALAIDILTDSGFLSEIKDGEHKTAARRYEFLMTYREHQDPISEHFAQGFVQPEGQLPPFLPASSQLAPGARPDYLKGASSLPPASSLEEEAEGRKSPGSGGQLSKGASSQQLSEKNCTSCGAALNMKRLLSGVSVCEGCEL